MAEPSFARRGAAARKPATATTRAPRRPRATSAPAPNDLAPAAAPPVDEVAVRLAVALGELDDDVRRAVLAYRSTGLSDEQWAQATDLIRLGLATYRPKTQQAVWNLGYGLVVHARIQLLLGASRTVVGWYGPDAIETTLRGDTFGSGPDAVTPTERFRSTFNGRLRTIGRTLVPSTPPPTKKFRAYDPQAPLTTAELEEVFDFCDSHHGYRHGRVGARLARLVWLGIGTGAKNVDLVGATGTQHVERTAHAVVFTTAGEQPRRVPVLASCEAAVLEAAADAGDRPLLDRLKLTNITDEVVRAAGWDRGQRFALTAGRLRQTWLAAVLAAGVPYPAVLRAAGIAGERTWASVVARLPQLDEAAYETELCAGVGPLPAAGQLLLPGTSHPVPRIPLVQQP